MHISDKVGFLKNKYMLKAGKIAFIIFFIKGIAWLVLISMGWNLVR